MILILEILVDFKILIWVLVSLIFKSNKNLHLEMELLPWVVLHLKELNRFLINFLEIGKINKISF